MQHIPVRQLIEICGDIIRNKILTKIRQQNTFQLLLMRLLMFQVSSYLSVFDMLTIVHQLKYL